MEFIVISEENHEQHETYLHYCQWTGNEESLTTLTNLMKEADYETVRDRPYSSFWFSLIKVPESAVNLHRLMSRDFSGMFDMFQKHTGTFVMPNFEINPSDLADPPSYQYGKMMDYYFYRGRLHHYFAN